MDAQNCAQFSTIILIGQQLCHSYITIITKSEVTTKWPPCNIVSEILGRERNQNSGFSDSQLSGSTVIKTTEVIIRMLSL